MSNLKTIGTGKSIITFENTISESSYPFVEYIKEYIEPLYKDDVNKPVKIFVYTNDSKENENRLEQYDLIIKRNYYPNNNGFEYNLYNVITTEDNGVINSSHKTLQRIDVNLPKMCIERYMRLNLINNTSEEYLTDTLNKILTNQIRGFSKFNLNEKLNVYDSYREYFNSLTDINSDKFNTSIYSYTVLIVDRLPQTMLDNTIQLWGNDYINKVIEKSTGHIYRVVSNNGEGYFLAKVPY